MKPRIFISSTFYDLKYIREDLSNFIKVHDFEPILFEDGDIGYTPGQPLDKSCYEAMSGADMVILIIGGNYGSPATGESGYGFEEYMSVTRNEFKTAIAHGIPLYAFVDRKVYTEYGIYELNMEQFENESEWIKFQSTKNVNVFRFIREVKSIGNISITEFDKIIDIKEFLSKQWSDMFKAYLNILKEKQSTQKVEATVDEMKLLIRKMDVMLDTVGKKILTEDNSNEYQSVLGRQKIVSFCDILLREIVLYEEEWIEDLEERRKYIDNLLLALYESVNEDIWEKLQEGDEEEVETFFEYFEDYGIYMDYCDDYLDTVIRDNIELFQEESLRKSMAEELMREENYERFFD